MTASNVPVAAGPAPGRPVPALGQRRASGAGTPAITPAAVAAARATGRAVAADTTDGQWLQVARILRTARRAVSTQDGGIAMDSNSWE